MSAEIDRLIDNASLDLYAAVMAVRAGRDGSGVPLAPEEEAALVTTVRQRLAEWGPSLWPQRQKSDDLLRAFLVSVLEECGL